MSKVKSNADPRKSLMESLSLEPSQDVESIVGYVGAEYTCTYQGARGTLFAGSKGILYRSSSFLFGKEAFFGWEYIRQIQKMDNNDGGGILVLMKDEKTHSFGNMPPHLERIWIALVNLHNDALLDRVPRLRSSSISSSSGGITPRGTLRRRQSDPMLQSLAHMGLHDDPWYPLAEAAENEDGDHLSSLSAPPVYHHAVSEIPVRKAAPPPPTTTSITRSSSMPPQTLSIPDSPHAALGPLQIKPIDCVYNKARGQLRVGQQALYFSGRQWWPWSDVQVWIALNKIQQIQRISNGIRLVVTTTDGAATGIAPTAASRDGSSNDALVAYHNFTGIEQSDQLWALLIAVQNEFLTNRRHKGLRTHRRNNSDPTMLSQLLSFDKINIVGSYDSATSPGVDMTDATKDSTAASQQSTQNEETDWEAVCKSKFTNVVVNRHELPCSLDEFANQFVLDDAPFSIGMYLASRGDKDIALEPWKDNARFVSYIHPVNAPMAPPTALATKEQTLRRFEDRGWEWTSKTVVKDVPLTDCFYVMDRLLIQAAEDRNAVLVTMEYEISFIKSTMFKGIITKSTNSEFVKYLSDYASFMSQALGDPAAAAAVPTPVANVGPAPPSTVSLAACAIIAAFALVLLLQLYILNEVRSLKQDMALLLKQRADKVE